MQPLEFPSLGRVWEVREGYVDFGLTYVCAGAHAHTRQNPPNPPKLPNQFLKSLSLLRVLSVGRVWLFETNPPSILPALKSNARAICPRVKRGGEIPRGVSVTAFAQSSKG